MILKAFAKNIHEYAAKIPPVIILTRWLKDILVKEPENNVEKIIHTELTLLQQESGMYAVVGTTPNGQKLLENLYNLALSFENQDYSRWIHNLKANSFEDNDLD